MAERTSSAKTLLSTLYLLLFLHSSQTKSALNLPSHVTEQTPDSTNVHAVFLGIILVKIFYVFVDIINQQLAILLSEIFNSRIFAGFYIIGFFGRRGD